MAVNRVKLGIMSLLLTICAGTAVTASPVRKRTLSGGVSLIVMENHAVPLAAVHIWISVGSKDEKDDIRGVSHFLEHMVFKGTARRPLGQIDRELDTIGAENNAMTSYDFTAYTVVGPSAAFSTMLDVQVDMVMNPTLDPVELEKEREIIIEEIRQEDDVPESVLWDSMLEAAYPNHPYRHAVIGTIESVKGITRDAMNEYHKKKYIPSNIAVVIVGDVNEEEAAVQVEQAFSSYVAVAPPIQKFILGMSEPGRDRKESRRDISRTYLAVCFPGVSASESDWPALEVAAALLGNGPGSILVRKLKDELGLVDSIQSHVWAPHSPGLLIIEAVLPPRNLKAVEMALFRELEIIKTIYPLDEQALKRARAVALSQHLFQTETYDQKAEMIGWLNTAANVEIYNSYAERLTAITLVDLKRVLRKYLDFDQDTVAIVKPLPQQEVAPGE